MEASVAQPMKIIKMNINADERLLFDAEEKMNLETYQMLLNLLEGVQIDNMKLLKALIYAKEDLQPLLDGSTKRRVCSSNTLQHHHCTSGTITFRQITNTTNATIRNDLDPASYIIIEVLICIICAKTGKLRRAEEEECAVAHIKPRLPS